MGQAFSKLMAQHNENEMVLKELKMLEDDAKVFKLVGPVLLSQVALTLYYRAVALAFGPLCFSLIRGVPGRI